MQSKREKIAVEEGFESRVYKCPADKLTIGYGFNLEAIDMPKEVADLWLSINIGEIEDRLNTYAWYQYLNYPRQVAIVDMAYQMGISGLLGFAGMISAISEGDYHKASEEMLDSRYAKQTPARAHRNAEIMRAG